MIKLNFLSIATFIILLIEGVSAPSFALEMSESTNLLTILYPHLSATARSYLKTKVQNINESQIEVLKDVSTFDEFITNLFLSKKTTISQYLKQTDPYNPLIWSPSEDYDDDHCEDDDEEEDSYEVVTTTKKKKKKK